MICEKCGADIPEGSETCPICGAPLGEAPKSEELPAADQGEARADENVSEELPAADQGEAAPAAEESGEAPAEGESESAASEEAPADDVGGELPADSQGEQGEAPDGVEGEDAVPPAEPVKKKRTGFIAGIAVAAVVVVAAVAIGVFFAGRSDDPADKVLELVDCLPENETDVALETIGVPSDTVLLTVNGDQEVTAEEYLYWLGNITSYYDMISTYSGGAMDLTQEAQDGVTWDEQLKLAARDNTVLLALTPSLAKEYGVELTDEELQELADSRADNIESAGGEAMYAYQLQAMGISDETALRLDAAATLYSKFQEAWVEQEAEKLSAEEMAAYAEENDILRAKHILLLTRDMDTGEAYSDEEKAEQKAKADDLLAQLRADPDKFDEFMNANSEDSGLESYPDGYLFTAGEMVSEFEEGTRALAFGEISEVIESDYGYHIILRLDPDCDESRQDVAGERFSDMVQVLVDEANVEESEVYGSFTTADYYEKLTAFQDALPQPESESEADVTDQSQAELEPDGQTAP